MKVPFVGPLNDPLTEKETDVMAKRVAWLPRQDSSIDVPALAPNG